MKVDNVKLVVERINQWQAATIVHSLTCGWNSKHNQLVPEVRAENNVVLKCPDCPYTQDHIPQSVFDNTLENQLALVKSLNSQRQNS